MFGWPWDYNHMLRLVRDAALNGKGWLDSRVRVGFKVGSSQLERAPATLFMSGCRAIPWGSTWHPSAFLACRLGTGRSCCCAASSRAAIAHVVRHLQSLSNPGEPLTKHISTIPPVRSILRRSPATHSGCRRASTRRACSGFSKRQTMSQSQVGGGMRRCRDGGGARFAGPLNWTGPGALTSDGVGPCSPHLKNKCAPRPAAWLPSRTCSLRGPGPLEGAALRHAAQRGDGGPGAWMVRR
jgi:hypothetical protein